jgi:hypothetical protein
MSGGFIGDDHLAIDTLRWAGEPSERVDRPLKLITLRIGGSFAFAVEITIDET